jgi:hypothetical protein
LVRQWLNDVACLCSNVSLSTDWSLAWLEGTVSQVKYECCRGSLSRYVRAAGESNEFVLKRLGIPVPAARMLRKCEMLVLSLPWPFGDDDGPNWSDRSSTAVVHVLMCSCRDVN